MSRKLIRKNIAAFLAITLLLLAAFIGCDNGSSGDAEEAAKASQLVNVRLTVGGEAAEAMHRAVSVGSGVDWSSLTYKYKAIPQWTSAEAIHGAVTTYTALPSNYVDGVSLGKFKPGQWIFWIQILNGSTPIYEGHSDVVSISTSSASVTVPVSKITQDATPGSVSITVTAPTVANAAMSVAWSGTASGSGNAAKASADGIDTFTYTASSLAVGSYTFTLSHPSASSGAAVTVDLVSGATATITGHLNNGIWQVGSVTVQVPSITISDGITHGTVTSDVAAAAVGDKVVLYINPDSGYILSGAPTVTKSTSGTVAVTDISDANGVAYTFTMPDVDVTVTASFTGAPVNTITVTEVSHGSMTASKASGTATEKIYLVAEPDNGYKLSSVTVTKAPSGSVDVTAITAGSTYWFEMPDASVTVTPAFEAAQAHTVATSITAGAGTISTNAASYSAGVPVVVNISEPNSGYQFGSLSVSSASGSITPTEVTAGRIYTFTMPDENVTAAATFLRNNLTVSQNAMTNGSVSISKTSSVVEGETITLTISPDSGYTLNTLTAKDASNNNVTLSGSGNTRTFIMPDSNVTVTPSWTSYSPVYVSDVNSLNVGDIVLGNGKYVTAANYALSPKSYIAVSNPVGVVAYKGTTGSYGITGKVYMVGLRQGGSLRWAPSGTTGYNTKFSTSDTGSRRLRQC